MRRPISVALALAAAASLIAAPAVARPQLSPAQTAQLEKGQVVVVPARPADNDGFAANAYGLIAAPPARVWPVLRECGRYKEFMPRTKLSEVRQGTPDKGVCFLEISLPFPFSNLWAETNSTGGPDGEGGFRRSWTLRRGTYSKNQGSWTLHPWGEDGGQTLLVYQIEASPNTVLPDAILRSAQKDTIPDVYTAVRKRLGL